MSSKALLVQHHEHDHYHSNTTTTDYSIEWTNYPRTGKKRPKYPRMENDQNIPQKEWQNTPTYKSNQNTPTQ